MQTLSRTPTIEEVRAACKATGLPESYWWMRGGNLNRPTIARLSIGIHSKEGAYVLIWFGDNCPAGGYKADVVEQWGPFQYEGPISGPTWEKTKKNFADMTLEDMFDLEREHGPTIGG